MPAKSFPLFQVTAQPMKKAAASTANIKVIASGEQEGA